MSLFDWFKSSRDKEIELSHTSNENIDVENQTVSQIIHTNENESVQDINNDNIDKICFIDVYLPQEFKSGTVEIKTFYHPIRLEIAKIIFVLEKLCNHIVDENIEIYKFRNLGYNTLILEKIFYPIQIKDIQGITRICYSTNNLAQFSCALLEKLDIIRPYYCIEGISLCVKMKLTSSLKEEIMWKIDALKTYFSLDKHVRSEIISNNSKKFDKYQTQKHSLVLDLEKERKHFEEKAKQAEERQEIEKAKQKLIESNRKKEIKAKAKKQLELQGKIESYELYGDILYRGKIYTVKSRTDIENFLKQIHDGIF